MRLSPAPASCLALVAVGAAAFLLFAARPVARPTAEAPSPSRQATVAGRASTGPARRPFPVPPPAAAARSFAALPPISQPAGVRPKLRQLRETPTEDEPSARRLLGELTSLLTDANTAEIVSALSPEELDTSFGAIALGRWLDLDPRRAADWIAARSGATEEQALLVARRFLPHPADLASFCDRLPDSPWKQSLLAQAGRELLSANPAAALALAQRMNPGPARDDVLQTVAYGWMDRDPPAATAWITGMGDAPLREQLLAAGAKALAHTDGDLAAAWLSASVTTAPLLRDTTLSVVETWATRAPADAASWVARLPAADTRIDAADLVVRDWLQTDPVAAIVWTATLPDRDRLLAKWAAAGDARDHPAPDPQ